MFEIYPGFEELTLRAQIEWQGRTRPIAARLERWPLDKQFIVKICHFEDAPDDGEWVLRHHLGINATPSGVADGGEIEPARAEKIVAITDRTLRQPLVYLGRLVELPLPDSPRFALCCPAQHRMQFESNHWVNDLVFYESFDFAVSPFHLDANGVRAALLEEWNNSESDARFAWQWAQWSYEEKEKRSVGTQKDRSDLKRIATLMLQCADVWQDTESWTWNFSLIVNGFNEMFDDEHNLLKAHPNIEPYRDFLRSHFVPQRRDDWFDKHRCVEKFWQELVTDEVEPEWVEVEAHRLHSAHEQIEARLALRDWLRDAATPDVVARLMASLYGRNA